MKFLHPCLVLLCVTVAPCCSAQPLPAESLEHLLQAEQSRIDTIARISAVTLAIFGPQGDGGGSGVVITPDGYALTNFHVAKPCGDHMLCGMNDGKLYDAVVVGVDPTGDVALIKLLGRDDFPAAELGNSDSLRIGDWCFVVGNPFLLATDFTPTVTYGIVSGIHRYQYPSGTLLEYADCIQTDASINPGNSGGPLFDSQGKLVGINGRGSFEKRGRVNVGVGYAISINQIKKFYGYLLSGRIVDHATAGFTVSTDADGRVIVSDILPTSDAYRRGLRYDDEIVSLGGKPIRSANEFKNVLGTYPRGWRIRLGFRQADQRREVLIRLDGVHSRQELLDLVQSGPAEMPGLPDDDPEAPRPSKKEDRPAERPKVPGMPAARRQQPPPPPLPAQVAAKLESRQGFANYYFNRQNIDRLWTRQQQQVNLLDQSGEWRLRGVDEAGKSFELILRNDESFYSLATGSERVDLKDELDKQLAPENSGGLLLAFSMWRRLLTLGPSQFGEVYYLGTVPADGDEQHQLDVLVGIHDAIEVHFQFETTSGQLRRIELFTDPGNDPCELLMRAYGDFAGQALPKEIVVRHGDTTFTTLRLEQFEAVPAIQPAS